MLLFELYWSDQATILHKPQQLSCCGLYTIVACFDHKTEDCSKNNINKISITSPQTLSEMGPSSLGLDPNDMSSPESEWVVPLSVSTWEEYQTCIILW